MADAVLEVEAKIVGNLAQGLKDIAGNMRVMEAASKASTEAVARSYDHVEKAAQASLTRVSNAESQAANISKTTAAFRLALQKEAAAQTVASEEQKANALARTQARQEQEYLRAEAQARLAEAASSATFFDRKIAMERESHASRMQALVGNDSAQEAEVRRHQAVVARLESEGMVRAGNSARTVMQRAGALGNQFQGLQMAFMAVNSAAGETDGKFGQMIGRTGMLASGAMGMAQSFAMVKTEMAGMSLAMGGGLAAIAAVGLAIGLLLQHQKEMKELASKNDWFGDPAKFAAVAAAIKDYDDAQKALKKTSETLGAVSDEITAQFGGNIDAALALTAANEKLTGITGKTREELQALYGDLTKAHDAYMLVADQRIADAAFELRRAILASEKDGVEKSVAIQQVANEQALNNIKAHYEAIALDGQKSKEERLRAKEDEGRELAIREKTNAALLAAARKSAGGKSEDTDAKEAADRAIQAFHKQMEEQYRIDKEMRKERQEEEAADVAAHYKRLANEKSERRKLEDVVYYDDSLKQLQLAEARELEVIDLSEQAKASIKERYELLTERLQKDSAQRSGQVISQGLDAIMGFYHKHGAAYKVWAQAKNAVDTALAAMAAYESAASIPYVGWIMGPVAAASAVAVGVANAAQINGAAFQSGGFTGYGADDEAAGTVHRNEFVWDAPSVRRAGGPAAVDAMRRGVGGGGHMHVGGINITVHAAPGVDGQAVSRQVGNEVESRLRTLKGDLKRLEYMNVSEE